MSKDYFHDTVKRALEKDGWKITDDPFIIRDGKVALAVDLAAEKLIAAERGTQKIAVEIKSFLGSIVNEFNSALGQYLGYLQIIHKKEPDRLLYLAIPVDVNTEIMRIGYYTDLIDKYKLQLIVYDPNREVISEWIN